MVKVKKIILDNNIKNEIFNYEEKMFSRNILALSKLNFQKLTKIKVCVIGIGGVGSVICEELVRLGVKNITYFARGNYDYGNINRQIPATFISVKSGTNKIHAMAERLYTINPHINLKPLYYDVVKNKDEVFKIIKKEKIKIIFNCVDELFAQNIVAKISRKLNCFMIMGGVIGLGLEGIITTFKQSERLYEELFCLKEIIGENYEQKNKIDVERTIKNNWIKVNSHQMPKWLKNKYIKDLNLPYPVLTPIPWIISSFMITEFLKIVTSISKPIFSPKIIYISSLHSYSRIIDLSKRNIIKKIIPWRP